MTPPSSLAQAHPDHPKLEDLGIKPDGNAPAISSTGLTYSSPSQQSSHSDNEEPPEPSSVGGMLKRPGGFTDGPNARSKSVTVAEGDDTYGELNCHPASNGTKSKSNSPAQQLKNTFRVGVSEDRNKRCRKTMEDAHSFVYDFAGVNGQGYFAVFDGHAGKHAAEWCGQNFHEFLLDALLTYPSLPIPDLLNRTFHAVDSRLSQLTQAGKTSSGCTAVTAFLRVEHADETEPRGFTNPNLSPRGLLEGKNEEDLEQNSARERSGSAGAGGGGSSSTETNGGSGISRRMSGKRIRDFVRGLTGSGEKDKDPETVTFDGDRIEAIDARSDKGLKRVLYTANVGDARAVLSRAGKAVRLTYDHKGSDRQEAKRITDAGGFVMNNRVNGVLAVTRSLGDTSMKEFVVGSPYTTETVLDDEDEFLIVACDGLWDVCDDQAAVDLIRPIEDAQEASKKLLEHAISNYSTDNLSVMVVRFHNR